MKKLNISLILIFFIVLSLFLNGCASRTLEDAMKKANVNFREIVYIEEDKVEDGVAVFYEARGGYGRVINVGYIRKTLTGWKWVFGGGSVEKNPSKDIDWVVALNNTLPVIYGTVNNPKIKTVRVTQPEGMLNHSVEIIKVKNGLRIWRVFSDKPITPPVNIKGLPE